MGVDAYRVASSKRTSKLTRLLLPRTVAFKPRTSSNLAVQASSSPAGSSSLDGMNDDNIDSDIATPPSQNHNGIDDSSHRQDVDMSSTPPRASHHDLTNGNDTVASASYVTVDDSDGDDLSDPPPLLTPAAAKPKLLTKKRPASTTNGGTTAKKPKKTNVKGQDDSQTDVHVPRRIAAPGQSALCHHHRAVCPGPLLRCTRKSDNETGALSATRLTVIAPFPLPTRRHSQQRRAMHPQVLRACL